MKYDFIYPVWYNAYHARPAMLQRLGNSINSVRAFKDQVRVCIIDFSKDSIENWIKGNFPGFLQYIHIPQTVERFFSAALIRNVGVKKFVSDEAEIFFLSDVDLLYPQDYVDQMVHYYRSSPDVVRVTPTNLALNAQGTVTGRGEAPGNGLVKKETFMKVRGFWEQLEGYSAEDVEVNTRMGCFGQYLRSVPVEVRHQWHPELSPRDKYGHTMALWQQVKPQWERKEFHHVNPEKWGEV